ncbi:Integrin alpha-11 [Ataeniobius toweri]|uniref:Integrin alpha-11 n=1 Tax=Ataeniobius toweri TaxID=208326 RepID=A0ABU7BSY2_9TELE|nr:Integrin alpha-11 [Ataeniobius toweri]
MFPCIVPTKIFVGGFSNGYDGVLLGAVGAYDWNGAVLKKTKHGKVFSPKSSYKDEFPEALKNHAAYLGNFCYS